MTYYEKSVKEVIKELKTSQKGLSKKEVTKRLNKYGKNVIGTKRRWYSSFIKL